MANPFDKFKTQTKKVKIVALDNAEVEIRELTLNESNEFYKKMIVEIKEDGSASIDYKAIFGIKLEKIATAMTEPKLSVDELKELSESASNAINEIADAIDGFSGEGKKKK